MGDTTTTPWPPADGDVDPAPGGEALVPLTRAECMQRLRQRPVGRLAVAVPRRAPLVVPVRYAVDGATIVFGTAFGDKLRFLKVGPVSFQVDAFDLAQVDAIDHDREMGWSVLVQGPATEIPAREVAHLPLPLRPWLHASEHHWVRIRAVEVTGRRVAREPPDATG